MCLLNCLELSYEREKAQREIEYLKATNIVTDTEITQKYECKLCMERFIEIVFLPCGHALACRKCAKSCIVCPVCALHINLQTSIHMM